MKMWIFMLILLMLSISVNAEVNLIQSAIDGNSMYPTFEDSEVVYTRLLGNKETLDIDKIYAYKPEWKSYKGNMIFHRLYWIFYVDDVPFYIFKGDNNPEFDPPVQRYQVKEVYYRKLPIFV